MVFSINRHWNPIGGKMRAHLNALQVYRRQNITRIEENQFSTE